MIFKPWSGLMVSKSIVATWALHRPAGWRLHLRVLEE